MGLVLASGSWLRRTILEKSEFDFEVFTKEIDERAIEDEHLGKTDGEIAVLLAKSKAEAVSVERPMDVVIAADTFAVLPNGERLHKPVDAKEAVELSLRQSGQTIRAVTGLAITYKGKTITSISETHIRYVEFDRQVIEKLLEGDDATIRNSGLGFFIDAPGFTLVEQFKGSYTGAMGLPMEVVRRAIKEIGYYNE